MSSGVHRAEELALFLHTELRLCAPRDVALLISDTLKVPYYGREHIMSESTRAPRRSTLERAQDTVVKIEARRAKRKARFDAADAADAAKLREAQEKIVRASVEAEFEAERDRRVAEQLAALNGGPGEHVDEHEDVFSHA